MRCSCEVRGETEQMLRKCVVVYRLPERCAILEKNAWFWRVGMLSVSQRLSSGFVAIEHAHLV